MNTKTSFTKKSIKNWWVENDSWILVALYFFSLPIGKTLWLPLIVMSLTGIYLFCKGLYERSLIDGSRNLLMVAACFFIPALMSLPDSLVQSRTLNYLSTYPLFIGVGYFLMFRVKAGFRLDKFLHALAFISFIWASSSYWQFFLPNDNPFPPASGGRYQGVFSGYWVLGYVLAAVIPFVSFGFWHQGKRPLSIFLTVFLVGACLISGNRASWLSLLFMFSALPFITMLCGYRLRLKQLGLTAFVLIAIAMFSSSFIEGTSVKNRIDYTLGFFKNPSFESFDRSSGGRGEIWSTAIVIGNQNPINGIGVDNFRYAYPYYAPVDSPFRFPNSDRSSQHKYTGAMYPHQLVLQQFAGAGWPGLIGVGLFYLLLIQLSWLVLKSRNIIGIGAVLAVWMGFLPFNTHLNFHGGWLTANFWVWVGLMFGFIGKSSCEPVLKNENKH